MRKNIGVFLVVIIILEIIFPFRNLIYGEVGEVIVSFDSLGGSSIPSQTIRKANKLVRSSDPSKSEYAFNDLVDRGMAINANWELKDTSTGDKKTYKVEFDSRGGSKINTQDVVEGERALEPENPTKKGYEFIDWYKDSKLKNRYRFSNRVYENKKIYAKWERNLEDSFEIDFDTDGASEIDRVKVEDGKSLKKPKDPFKPGYIFDGWYTDDDFKDRHKYDFKEEVWDDFTLYAKWKTDYNVIKIDFLVRDNTGRRLMENWDYYVEKNQNIMKVSEEALACKNKYLEKGKTDAEKERDKHRALDFSKKGKVFNSIAGLENQVNYKWVLYLNDIRVEEDEIYNLKLKHRDKLEWVYTFIYLDYSELDRGKSLIKKDKNIGYIGGYSDGSFRPNGYISREEVCKVLYFLADDQYFQNIYLEYNPYRDLARDRWSYEYIISLSQLNLFSGYMTDTFRPGEKITRGEVAVLLARSNGLDTINKNYFHDATDHFGRREINAVAHKKWIKGYNTGEFRPYNYITRGEFVTMVNNSLGQKSKKPKKNKMPFRDVGENTWYYEEVLKAI